MFIGENLLNLRVMHGYSRKQLAEMIDVSEQAIWQYENYYTSPKLQNINELKTIFNVKGLYFYREDMLERYERSNNIPLMNIAYRSNTMNVISKTQTEAKHLEYLDAFVNYITEKISVPTQNIIQLRDKCIDYLNHTNDSRKTQIETIAKYAREWIGLDKDSNDRLMFLIEKSGVFIFEKAIGEDIDAYSLWTSENRPFIILGNLKRSAVRRNFDLAHELGHLLLHYKVEFTHLDKNGYKEIEKEANLFAGAFLLPKEAFLEDMKQIGRKTNPDAYMDMKQKWSTSLQVLGYRAVNLDVLTAKEHRNYYAALHRRDYLKCEPLDETLPIKRPQKVKSIFDLVMERDIINFEKMLAKDWLIEVEFLYRLTGIDSDFFRNYFTKPDRVAESNGEIIAF